MKTRGCQKPISQCPILASARIVVIRSGSPKPSASLTNWMKLYWWKTSCIHPPLDTTLRWAWQEFQADNPRCVELRESQEGLSRAGCSGRRGDGHGLGTQGAAASAASRWHISDSYLHIHAKRKWAVLQTAGGFPFGTLSHSFFLFYFIS